VRLPRSQMTLGKCRQAAPTTRAGCTMNARFLLTLENQSKSTRSVLCRSAQLEYLRIPADSSKRHGVTISLDRRPGKTAGKRSVETSLKPSPGKETGGGSGG